MEEERFWARPTSTKVGTELDTKVGTEWKLSGCGNLSFSAGYLLCFGNLLFDSFGDLRVPLGSRGLIWVLVASTNNTSFYISF